MTNANPSFQLLRALLLILSFHPIISFQLSPPRQPTNGIIQLHAQSRRQYLVISSAALAATLLIPTQTAHANALLNYQGVYTDPSHPKGYRVLIGTIHNKATLLLQNDASEKMYEIPVEITTVDDGRMQFTFDYKSIDGSVTVGTFAKDKEGIPLIQFADGAWKKRETGPIGVYYDSSNPSKRIIIRQAKGAEWIVDILDGGGMSRFTAKAGNPILFRLSEGNVNGVFSMKEKTITFDDGTVWTKF